MLTVQWFRILKKNLRFRPIRSQSQLLLLWQLYHIHNKLQVAFRCIFSNICFHAMVLENSKSTLPYIFFVMRILIFQKKMLKKFWLINGNNSTPSLIADIFCHWEAGCSSLEGLSMKHAVKSSQNDEQRFNFARLPRNRTILVMVRFRDKTENL